MSAFSPQTFEEAKLTHKPLRRGQIAKTRDSLSQDGKSPLRSGIARKQGSSLRRRPIKSSAIPYGTNSVSRKKPKKKKLTDGQLKKRVWKEFSIFIRTRGADDQGFNVCVTCGVKKFWRELHAGHFIQGRLNANLFTETGTNPQCYSCNVGRYGAAVLYYKWMLANHGQEVIDELLAQNSQTRKWIPGELQALLDRYKEINEANPLTAKELS